MMDGMGRAAEHQPVIDLRHPIVGAVIGVDEPFPVPRQQISLVDIRVDINLQKLAGNRLEALVAVESVMHRRKAAARDGGDVINFVQQRAGAPVLDDRDLPRTAEHAMGETCEGIRIRPPSLLWRSPQDHMKISLDLKGFIRGLDPPMPTFPLPAEQQPDVMPCIPSLPSGP
jgi:hypothetical protein